MAKQSKKPADLNRLAAAIVGDATDDGNGEQAQQDDDGKDPAAVALGRRGGFKGGKARAEKLSAKRRTEIAKNAAATRWNGP